TAVLRGDGWPVVHRPRGRAVAAPDAVVGEDLEHRDRIGAGLVGEEHVPALLIAARAVRRGLDADLSIEDRLGALVQGREIEQVALRRPAIEALKAVDVDPLGVARSDEAEQLHRRAVALDVRLDADFRSPLPGENVQASQLAVARGAETDRKSVV